MTGFTAEESRKKHGEELSAWWSGEETTTRTVPRMEVGGYKRKAGDDSVSKSMTSWSYLPNCT